MTKQLHRYDVPMDLSQTIARLSELTSPLNLVVDHHVHTMDYMPTEDSDYTVMLGLDANLPKIQTWIEQRDCPVSLCWRILYSAADWSAEKRLIGFNFEFATEEDTAMFLLFFYHPFADEVWSVV